MCIIAYLDRNYLHFFSYSVKVSTYDTGNKCAVSIIILVNAIIYSCDSPWGPTAEVAMCDIDSTEENWINAIEQLYVFTCQRAHYLRINHIDVNSFSSTVGIRVVGAKRQVLLADTG
jgi:hypothetical protein